MQKATLNLAAIIAAVLLSACGGSSDDISPADTNNPTPANLIPTASNGQTATNNPVRTSPNTPTPTNQTSAASNGQIPPNTNNPGRTTPTNPNTQNPTNPGNRILAPAPSTPNAAERTAFNNSKRKLERPTDLNGVLTQGMTYALKVNGKEIINFTSTLSRGNFTDIPNGFSSRTGTFTISSGKNSKSWPVIVRSYQNFRSGVVATYETSSNEYMDISFYGVNTPAASIPKTGKATYTGTAFDKNNIGRLIYNVDFGAKTGQGYVDGLTQYGRVTLNRGEIKEGRLRTVEIRDGGQVSGTATATKGASLNYVMQFFGNQAEEVAGYAANKTHGIALHGTRGEITQ